MTGRIWKSIVVLSLVAVLTPCSALADDVSFQSEGRASLQGWKIEVPWEKYDGAQINIGSSPSDETPAFVFDLRGDGITVDFRNEDFKTNESFGLGNIANPRPVEDLKAALSRAKQDVHFLYQIWVGDNAEAAGVILTPYQIYVTKSGSTVIVKLTGEALTERDVKVLR